jgi:hypothetical protein
MYIGKPQRVFTIEPLESPVHHVEAERRSGEAAAPSANGASRAVTAVEVPRGSRTVVLGRDEPR